MQTPSPVRGALKRKNAFRPGSLDWEELNSELPAGPTSMAELYNWTEHGFDVLQSKRPGSLSVLTQNLLNGISLITHYSGKGTAEAAFCDVADHACSRLDALRERRGQCVTCASACDNSPLCVDLLLHHDRSSRPVHVFGDICERIDEKLQSRSNEEVKDYLEKHQAELYNPESKAFCFRHNRPCRLWDGLEWPGTPSRRSGLLVSAAGFSCTDWSPRRAGKRPGLQGATAPVYYRWVAENRSLRPDVLMWENSSCFDPKVLEEHLGDGYVHAHVLLCPSMIGWPQNRSRFFGVAILRETCSWVGSPDDFLELFVRAVELDGDAFFQADENEVRTMMQNRAHARGHHVSREAMPSLHMAVSPSGMAALEDYKKLVHSRASMSGAFLCDLDQNAGYASCGSFLPSCPTHSSIFSMAKQRLLTGKEMLAAMGENVYACGPGPVSRFTECGMSQDAPAIASGPAGSQPAVASGNSNPEATAPSNPASPKGVMPLELNFEDAEEEFVMPDSKGPEMEAAGEEDDDGEKGEAPPVNPDMCACCQEELKCERSVYGSECKKALNNVEKREVNLTQKKGERWTKWCEVKKAGGPRLHAILLGYRETCSKSEGPGKNRGSGSFDFMNHYEAVESVAEVATGERLAYMPLTKWLTIAQEDHGYDINEAKKKWKRKEMTLPKSQKRETAKGVLLLPMPKEYYIDGSNKARHIKGMRMEGSKIKKPTAENFAQAEVHVSSGHLGFSDKAFSKVGGGSLLDNVQAGASLMFAPDGDSIFGEGDNFRKHMPAASAASAEVQLTPTKRGSGSLAAASPDAATPSSAHGCNTPGSATKESPHEKQTENNKKRRKAFDTVAARNKVVEKIAEDLIKDMNAALTTALQEAQKATDQLQAEFGDHAAEPLFKAYSDTIQSRRTLVELVKGSDSAALEAKISEYQDMKLATIDDAEKLRTLKSEGDRLTEKAYLCEDEDSIKLVLKGVKDSVSMFKRLQAALNRATSDLKRSLDQKKKRAAGLVEKRKKEEMAKKKKDEKDMQKKIKSAAKGTQGDLPCLLLDASCVSDMVMDIPMFDDLTALKQQFRQGGSLHQGGIYMVKDASTIQGELGNQSYQGFLQIFETQFPMSKQAKERNRAQSAIKIQGVTKLKEAMLSYCSSKCSAFASSCNADLAEVGAYGFTSAMTYAGTEYFGMSTVRYAIKGEREIVAASAEDLWAVLQENGVEMKMSNERPVSSILGDRMWQSRLEEPWIQSLMLKGKEGASGGSQKIFYRGVIPEGSLLFVPSGFIVCERSLNGRIGLGLRLSVQDSTEKAQAALQKLVNVHKTYSESTCKLLSRWTDALSPGSQWIMRLAKLLRLIKLAKSIKSFDSLYLLTASIASSASALIWSGILICIVQLLVALVLSTFL
ncbi:unnamed protein product, partial [Symbiodinium sp. KB8]